MVVTPEFKRAIGNVLKKVASDTFTIDKDIKLMVGVDTSGSMSSKITDSLRAVEFASLFGALMKKSHAKTNVFAVATDIEEVELRKQDDLFSMVHQIEKTDVGYGTYFEQLLDHYRGEKYIILLTDSEAADDLETKWLRTNKPKGAKLIVWQLMAYYTKLSKDPSVVYISGYSDRLLGLVKNIIEGKVGQIEEIEKLEF